MRYATDQVFKPLDPMRPVDTAQAFAIERKHKPLKILGITFGAIVALLLIAYAGIACTSPTASCRIRTSATSTCRS